MDALCILNKKKVQYQCIYLGTSEKRTDQVKEAI